MKIKTLLLLSFVSLPAMANSSLDLDDDLNIGGFIGLLVMVLLFVFVVYRNREGYLYLPSEIKNFTLDSNFNHTKTWSVTPKYLSDPWFVLFTKPSLFSNREAHFQHIFFRDASKVDSFYYVGDLPNIFNCHTGYQFQSIGFHVQRLTVFCFENKNTPCRYNLSRKKDSRDNSFFRNSSTTIQEIKYSVSGPETFDSGVKSLKSYTNNEPFNEKFEQNTDNLETFKNFLTDKKIKLLLKLDNTTVIEATPKVTLFYDWPKIVDMTELKDKYSYFEDIHKILDC